MRSDIVFIMKTYITYGHGNTLNLDKIPRLQDLQLEYINTSEYNNKVKNTLWGSPVDSRFSWKEFCVSEGLLLTEDHFQTHFLWTMREDSKILTVETLEDLEKVPFIIDNDLVFEDIISAYINFSSIVDKGYVAVELSHEVMPIGHMRTGNPKECAFDLWDCSSIMVLDKDYIVPL